MSGFIVTIDGPAASGKSTVSRLLAKRMGASFLDTGAMYRAVTLAAMQNDIDMNNEDELLSVFRSNEFKFSVKEEQMSAFINDVDVTEKIREPAVTANARFIASSSRIREKLVQMQQQFSAGGKKIVTEGRDQGTVVFPNADIKFFLTADTIERAKRRQAELRAKGSDKSLEQIQSDIEARDRSDEIRTVGPLKPASDAIIIDTTNLTIEEVVAKLLDYIEENV